MKVELLNDPTLDFVDSGVGMCWDKGSYGADTEKGIARMDRVCNKFKHASMLRFCHLIFRVEVSTSVLLEAERHQIGVDWAVKSTRYCIKRGSEGINIELSRNDEVNEMMTRHIKEIIDLIDTSKIPADDLKLLLPQGFIYEGQVQFNIQSLKHFYRLRSDKSAHYHIVDFANALIDAVPEKIMFLIKDSTAED